MSRHLPRRIWLTVPTLALLIGMLTPTVASAATDTDRDGLPNAWERTYSLTSPSRADTDRDGIRDGREDPDRDGLTNRQEYVARMHPRRADTDRDGIRDGREDNDGDGLRTAFEFKAGTSPRRADTDGDGRRDGRESPDHDNLMNISEQRVGTNPRVADTDHDGWSDGVEYRAGTNPLKASSHPPATTVPPPPPPPSTPPPPPPSGGISVPASIDATCATDVSPALNAWIAGRPNGSTLIFPAGSCYKLGGDAGINITNRSGLTLVGTGSTLRLRTTGASVRSSGFLVKNSTHIVIRGFAVDGGNTATGTTGAQAAVRERISGAMIFAGSKFVEFDRVSWDRLYGFGVFISSNEGTVWPEDIWVHDSTVRGGEMGIGIVAGRRIKIERNAIVDTVIHAIDLEPDPYSANGGGFEDVLISNNDVTRYGWSQSYTSWFVAAVPDPSVENTAVMDGLTITGNRIHVGAATADNGNADGLGGLGIRADTPIVKRNVTITNNWTVDNDTRSATRAVVNLLNVVNLTITGNRQPIANGSAYVRDSGTSGTRVISANDVTP